LNFEIVCVRCGLLSPAAIDEVRHVLREMDELARRNKHVRAPPFADVFRDVAARRGILQSRHIESLLRSIARARLQGPDDAVLGGGPATLHPAPVPEEDVRAFHASAMRLTLGELTLAVPFSLLTLLLYVVAPGYSLSRLMLAGVSVIWLAVIGLTWIHLRRKDPFDYWREECGTEAVRRTDFVFVAEPSQSNCARH
jgi:hypothetical protein